MKRSILTLVLLILFIAPSHAVEKGKDLDNTIRMLHLELEALSTD